MRGNGLKLYRLQLVRSAAILSVAGLAACSSDVARFGDSFYNGAVPQQTAAAPAQNYPGNLDAVETGSVQRAGGFGMPGYGGAPGAAPVAAVSSQPVATPSVDRATLAPPAAATAAAAPAAAAREPGWSSGGSSKVVLREGETIYSLSKRFGVPSKAILAANGLTDGGQARAGQEIVIPAYSYGQNVPVSAPDNDPKTRAAAIPAAAPQRPAPQVAAGEQSLRVPDGRQQGAASGTVTVAAGDSINAIARRAGVSAVELRRVNGLTSDNIRIGQTLKLPGAQAGTQVAALTAPATRTDASPAQPAAAPAAPTSQREPRAYQPPRPAAEQQPTAPAAAQPAPVAEAPKSSVAEQASREVAAVAPSSTGIEQFRWPVQGRVVKRFGEKDGSRRNDGLNISVPRGTPVKAAENGVVIYAGDGLKEFGKTVLIKHEDGLVTVYGHADDILVERGATVRRGQEIARAGMTGDVETPMLHFEVRKDSAPVDPLTYLQ